MKKLFLFLLLSIIVFVFVFNVFLFPTKYKNEISVYSQTYNIKPELIASVINVESGFNKNAVSNKGAVGLMQILPSTAQWVCERNNLTYTNDILKNPENNIEIGTIYLKYLVDKFKDVNVALCAYNAGEGVVSEWLNNSKLSLDGNSLKEIPYTETKNYIGKINNNLIIYKILLA